jgi:gliding motility-associated-like protein
MKQKLLLLLLLIITPLFAQNKNQSIGFKENKGQIIDQNGKPNDAVKYLLNSRGLNVQLKKHGFSYDVYEMKKHPIKHHLHEKSAISSLENNDKKIPEYALEYIFHRIDIDFVNSNPNVELVTDKASTDYDNYYNVPNTPEGITNVHQYQQITYKNIYPNIDVVFSIPKDSLKTVEYNFVVHPKGKISDIQMKFNGAKTELVDNKIEMNVRFGKMQETLPASWTENGIGKKEITVGYTKIKKNVYGFTSSSAVSGKTVIIDPVPTRLWGTYYGGAQTDYITEANNDRSGNLLITGSTFSRNNFTTSGAFITNHYSTQPSSFEPDGYIAKFDTNGYRIWGTYLNAFPYDIDVDSDNNIISSGYAYNFSTIGTLGTHKPNKALYNHDGYILKLDANGIRKWGTFYGDTGEDIIYSAVIDLNNNIIVTGYTGSVVNIATPGTHKATKIDYSSDVFLAKIGLDGQRIWGTYYGGSADDKALSIAIDENNNTYIVGETFSSDGIALGSSNQNYLNTNSIDGFIASFDPQGKIIYGTYHGGDKNDYFNKIDYNNQKLLVSGRTFSTSNIATINAPYPIPPNTINSYSAGLFSILNKNGTLEMGSYFEDVILDSGFDNYGNIFISGITSKTGIGTSNAYQQNLFNNYTVDSFIVKYKSNYVKDWGTYYGGRDLELESIIHIDRINGYIYIAGRTLSDNTMASNNAYQPLINGREDLYIAKFQDCISNPIISTNSPICIGNTLELKASGGTNYSWTGPNGFTSTLQNPSILNATAQNSGEYNCNITGTGGCDDTKKVDIIVGDVESPIPNFTSLPILTGDCNTAITTIPTATDNCAGEIIATTLNPIAYSLPGTYTVVWNYNDGNGNTSTQNQTITINNQPLPTSTSLQTFCIQQNATLNNISIIGQNIKWYNALANGTLLSNTTPLQNGTNYYASQTINGCESDRIPVLINIQNTLTPTGDTNQSFCSTQNATLNNIEITGTNIKWYDNSNTELPNITLISDNATYYATQTSNGCESVNKIVVNTFLINTLNATNYKVEFCDDANDGKETLDLSAYNQNLIANPTGNSFSYYNYRTAAENQIINDRINTINNYVLAIGSRTLFVRIDSQNGCHQVVELILKLYSKPKILINDIMPICEGSSITINAGAGYDNYLWSTGETSSTITIQNPGNYSVTVTNNYSIISCSSTKNFEVRKSNIATITSIDTRDWTDNQNAITVFVTGAGDFEYSTDGIHFQDSNQFSNLISDQYTVHVRDKNGCGTVTDEVYLLMYPKFFTANGDGFNDTWKIKFSDIEEDLTVKIFDRYGKLIVELKNNSGWNGTFNGQELPATDYWFVVTRANGKEYRGHFSLKR